MAENQQKSGSQTNQQGAQNEQEANATQPIATESESSSSGKQRTGDPGRTPGKAEGADDSSATTTGNG